MSQIAGRDKILHTTTPSPLHPRHLIKAQHNNLTPINSFPHLAQPRQHQATERKNPIRYAKRNKHRQHARFAKHFSLHPTPYTTFVAQLTTARALDNAFSVSHYHTHNHKHTQIGRMQHVPSVTYSHIEAAKPHPALNCPEEKLHNK